MRNVAQFTEKDLNALFHNTAVKMGMDINLLMQYQ